jgi:hypothetical protein
VQGRNEKAFIGLLYRVAFTQCLKLESRIFDDSKTIKSILRALRSYNNKTRNL